VRRLWKDVSPKDSNCIHCSLACFLKAHAQKERECSHCGTMFKSEALGGKFCSSSYKYKAFRARKAARRAPAPEPQLPIKLTAEIFDSWFQEAA